MSLGSWLRDRTYLLEKVYRKVEKTAWRLNPLIKKLGYKRVERWIQPFEDAGKKLVFECRTCGQCILHSTGMTCPMSCPKNLRNGPCGGTREDGHCEVKPEMCCVWVEAYERSCLMPVYGDEITHVQPPVSWLLYKRSAWITMLTGEDQELPSCWQAIDELTLLEDIQSIWPQESE